MKPNTAPGIILDFATVTHPAVLVHSLVIYRQCFGKIYVGEHSINHVYLGDPSDPMGPSSTYWFDLRDDEFAKALAQFKAGDPSNLSLNDDNLGLALRIFRHAIETGAIQILPTADEKMSRAFIETREGTIKGGIPAPGQEFHYGEFELTNDSPYLLEQDIATAIDGGHRITIAAQGFEAAIASFEERGLLVQDKEGVFRAALPKMEFKSLGDIFGMVDAPPPVIPTIVKAILEVEAAQKFQEELKLYLPKLALDAASAGTFGMLEMLYKVFKHRLGPRNRTQTQRAK